MDGEITIGTGLKTDKFKKQIAKFEKDMQKEEDKLELKLQAKEIAEDKLNKHKQEVQSLQQQYDKLKDSAMKYEEALAKIQANQSLTPAEYQAYKTNKPLAQEYYDLGEQIQKAKDKQSSLELTAQRTSKAYDNVVNKVNEYKQKIENVKIQKQVADVERLRASFNGVGSSIQKSIKSVARLVLGIFGIRSAYLALRRASSDLASYDQQYATNLEYIRYALTQMIAPVLQWIVKLAATLLGYINAIMQAWFGINLFSRGSAKNFQKMKAGAGGVAKAVKEIKKQLAGFDEINMLTDQSDSGAGGGGGAGGVSPDFDLSKFQGEVPDWLQWIIDHKDEILSTLAGIGAGLLFLKLGELAKNLGLIKGEMLGIKALGFGILVKGIIDLIKSLKGYLEEPSWENFGKVIKSIGEIILGVGILIGNVPLIVAGAIITIVGLIIKHWEDIKAFLQNGIDWLKGKSDWVHQMFGDTIGNIYDLFVDWLQDFLNFFDKQFQAAKKILDGIIEFVTGVFTGDWKKAWEGIKKIFSGLWDSFTSIVDFVLKTIIKSFQATGRIIDLLLETLWNIIISAAETVIKFISSIFSGLWESIKSGAQGTWDFIVRVFNGIGSFFSNAVNIVSNVFNSLWNAIKNGAQYAWNFIGNVFSGIGSFFSNIVNRIVGFFGNLGSSAGEAIAGAFKAVVNGVLRAVERILNSPIRAINSLISVINAVPRNKYK